MHDVRGAVVIVAKLMTKDPQCIQRDEPLRQAHRLMRHYRVRHLPVLDGDELVGLLSERDLYLLETSRGVNPCTEPVSEAMTEQPYCVPPDAEIVGVVREMRKQKYGSAVIVERRLVVGIFTRSDALRALEECLS